MEERLTDDTLTREQAMDVARHVGETALDRGRQQAQRAGAMASGTMEQAKAMARDLGEQAAAASDVLYQQGMRAGEYLTENVNEYPMTALLLAAAIGYGIAFLIHARWQTTG